MLTNHLSDAAATPPHFGFYEDFLRVDGVVAANGPMTFTAVGSGTFATQATNGGWGRLSGAATTDDSGGQLQAAAAHACTDFKNLLFKCRAQLNESATSNVATDSDFIAGLILIDTSIVASLPTDGIFFEKDDNATAIKCVVRVGGVNNAAITISNVMDKSVHTYGIAVFPNGASSNVEFSIDGARVARAENVTLPAASTFLTPSIAFQSGDATGTKFVDIDYVGSLQMR
jgi:hypothetical protein